MSWRRFDVCSLEEGSDKSWNQSQFSSRDHLGLWRSFVQQMEKLPSCFGHLSRAAGRQLSQTVAELIEALESRLAAQRACNPCINTVAAARFKDLKRNPLLAFVRCRLEVYTLSDHC